MTSGYQKVDFPDPVIILSSGEVENLVKKCMELAESITKTDRYITLARGYAASLLLGTDAKWEHVLNRALSVSDRAKVNLLSFQFVQGVRKGKIKTESQKFSPVLPVIFEEMGFVPSLVSGEVEIRRIAQPIFDNTGKAIVVEFDLSKPVQLGLARSGKILCNHEDGFEWRSVGELAISDATGTLEQVHKAVLRSGVFDQLRQQWSNCTPNARLNVAITPLGILAINTQALRMYWEEYNFNSNCDLSLYGNGQVLRRFLGPIAPGLLGLPDPEIRTTTTWLVDREVPPKYGDLRILLDVAMSIIDKYHSDFAFAFIGYKWRLRSYFGIWRNMVSGFSGKAELSDTRSDIVDHTENVIQEHRFERIGFHTKNTSINKSIVSRYLNYFSGIFSSTPDVEQRNGNSVTGQDDKVSLINKDDSSKTNGPTIDQQPKLVVIESDVGEDPNDPIYQQDTLLSLTARELDRFLEQLRKSCDGKKSSYATLHDGLNLFNETLVAGTEVPPYGDWDVTKSYNHIMSSEVSGLRPNSKIRTPTLKIPDENPQRLPETVIFPELGLTQIAMQGEQKVRQAAQPLFDKGMMAIQLSYFDDRDNPDWHRQEAWLRVEYEFMSMQNSRLSFSGTHWFDDVSTRYELSQVQKAVEDSSYMSEVDHLFQSHVPMRGHSLAVTPFGIVSVSGALFQSNLTDKLLSLKGDTMDWSLEAGHLRTLLGPCVGNLKNANDPPLPSPLAWFVDVLSPPTIGSLELLRQIAIMLCEVTGVMGQTVHLVGHAIQKGRPSIVIKTQ